MKLPIICICIGLTFFVLSFTKPGKNLNLDVDFSLAKVNKVDGFYLFYKSVPVANYERLGTCKLGIVMSGDLIKELINKSKKKFPPGEGLIITDNMQECDVIKFK